MIPRLHAGRRVSAIVAAAVIGLTMVSCSGGSDSADEPTPDTEPAADTPVFARTSPDLAVCAPDEFVALPDWPFDAGALLAPVDFDVDELTYVVNGITNDADRTIVAAMDTVFADFDVEEPTGGADDISLVFTGVNATVSLDLIDDDQDDCWDVALVAEYVDEPTVDPVSSFETTEADTGAIGTADPTADGSVDANADADADADVDVDADDGTGDAPDDPLDAVVSVGSGEIITARGTFPLQLTVCSSAPLIINGIADVGELMVEGNDDGTVTVNWTYTDGVEIVDPAGRALTGDGLAGTFVANGDNDEGPETLLIDFVCLSDQ